VYCCPFIKGGDNGNGCRETGFFKLWRSGQKKFDTGANAVKAECGRQRRFNVTFRILSFSFYLTTLIFVFKHVYSRNELVTYTVIILAILFYAAFMFKRMGESFADII
jgi:hypothetical protein